jgi:hypothetical protein
MATGMPPLSYSRLVNPSNRSEMPPNDAHKLATKSASFGKAND